MLADRVRMATFKDSIPEGYVLATDDDFAGYEDGWFRYIGTDDRVAIPHVIKGVPVTSYYSMFAETGLSGVYSNNSNVTDMSYMFSNSHVPTLYLNTSNVKYMDGMFENSSATTIDLSSFDTSNVVSMSYMFVNTMATTGYARTQADADRFNNSSGKPAGLTFVVK